MRYQIEEVFNKSLSRLQQQSIKVHKLLEATQLAGKPRLETRISLAQFKVGNSIIFSLEYVIMLVTTSCPLPNVGSRG
jgi:hypothetical protein